MATHERIESMLDKMVKRLWDHLMAVHSTSGDAPGTKTLRQDSENASRKMLWQRLFTTLVPLGIDHIGIGKRNSVTKSHYAAGFLLASE